MTNGFRVLPGFRLPRWEEVSLCIIFALICAMVVSS